MAEPETQFTVDGIPLEEFFLPKNGHKPVTRRQMSQLMQLLSSKAGVHEAMKVLEFTLRRQMREMIKEEWAKVAEQMMGEEKTEGGIIVRPGS